MPAAAERVRGDRRGGHGRHREGERVRLELRSREHQRDRLVGLDDHLARRRARGRRPDHQFDLSHLVSLSRRLMLMLMRVARRLRRLRLLEHFEQRRVHDTFELAGDRERHRRVGQLVRVRVRVALQQVRRLLACGRLLRARLHLCLGPRDERDRVRERRRHVAPVLQQEPRQDLRHDLARVHCDQK